MPSNVYARPSGAFSARVTVGGVQIPLGTFPTREEAQEAIARARRGQMPSTTTVREWADTWMDLYPGKRNAETAAHNRQMIDPFARALGSRRVDSITELEAQGWAVRYPGSVRYLRLMFSKAVRAGIADRNVWDAVEITRESEPRVPPTYAQVRALAGVAFDRYGPNVADMILFVAFSGLRLSEMADLLAADVAPDGSRVVVQNGKGGKTRTVAVFADGREALLRARPDVGRVWRSPGGRKWTRSSVSRVYGALCDETGVSGSFHALRHFCATWLIDRGASRDDVAVQLGHMDEAGHANPELVRKIYSHPTVEPVLARLEAVAG